MTFPKRKTLIPLIAIAAIFSMIAWSQYQKYQNVNRYVSNGKFPDITLLMRASSEGDIEQVQSLLDRGADIMLTDDMGPRTALYYAIRNATQTGNHEVVKLLLDAGADINDHYPSDYDDSQFCTLSAAIPYSKSKSSQEDLDLFSYFANLKPHDVSNHYCTIANIAVMSDKTEKLDIFLNSIDSDSAKWITTDIIEHLHLYEPDMRQRLNEIISKYK